MKKVCIFGSLMLFSLTAIPQEKAKPEPCPANHVCMTDDDKKDLTIIAQKSVILQQQLQLLSIQYNNTKAELASTQSQQQTSLQKIKQAHKWGEDVHCDLDTLTCLKVVPAEDEKKSK